MIRIERIVMRHMVMPLLAPFTTSFGTMNDKQFILIEATDESGLSGWSESVAFPEPSYNEETIRTNWHVMESFLIPQLLNARIDHPREVRQLFHAVRGNCMAKAALEGALWDLYAQKRGISLAQAIGGIKQKIEVGFSIGIKASVEQLLDTIDRNVAQGYKRIKIKIKPGWDVDVLARVRERFPDIALMADANSSYTLRDADHLRQLDAFRLTMIEQPLAYNDIVDHSRLQKLLRTPICLDESIHSAEDARKAIELQSCRIINIKIGRVGGIEEAIRLHDLCEQRGIPVWCGGMLESGIGRAHNIAISSLPNFTLPGDTAASANYWAEDIIEPEVVVVDGYIHLSDRPGIGYEVNLKKIGQRTQYSQAFRR